MLLYLLLPVMSTVATLIELSPTTARKTRQHLNCWRNLRQNIVSGSSEHLYSYGSRQRPFP